ncbi:MAG: N-acetylneuraminate synthase family protein [Candidatus Nomurabacteria bacterium]|nr:N-acetylneuraminate synthase family protein [Candidatus Nomurabacteria bacterium]
MKPYIQIGKRKIGSDFPPFVIAEIGINHEGNFQKAKKMIKDAALAGAECVKFQSHIVSDEMVPIAKKIIPGHTNKSIWDIMERCSFTEKEDRDLKKYVESFGMIYLSTPFSRAGADHLNKMGVQAFKIGSGECNNYPLIEHIAKFGKPIIISTGMNDVSSVKKTVAIFRKYKVPYALLNCTSMYPTPYDRVRLGGINELQKAFPDAVIGQSDHSLRNYTCFAAVALGASILEKHFTSDKKWKGPDIFISIDPYELKELITGTKAIKQAIGGKRTILKEEGDIINFAYACVVSIKDIKKGEKFTKDNIWVKRPGNGEIKAVQYNSILGKEASCDIVANVQIKIKDIKK